MVWQFRNSKFWRELTDDYLSASADILPRKWFENSRPGLVLSVAAWVGLWTVGYLMPTDASSLEELANWSQLMLYGLAALIVPQLGLRYTRKRWGGNPPTALVGFVMLLLAPLNALAMFLALKLFPRVTVEFGESTPKVVAVAAVAICLGYWAVLVWRSRVIGALKSRLDQERARADVAVSERQLMEAKLQALQAQIEPHFLYNTLANVQHLMRQRPDDADLMLTHLVTYLREALPKMRDSASTLRQEFALAQAYLNIARIRLGERLRVEVELPDALAETSFPPLIVQTLVENALKHGAEGKVGPVCIRLSAVEHEDEFHVVVADDGIGLGSIQGAGVGLRNTRERLAAIFGDRGRLELAPNEPSGLVATVRVPKEQK
jgi:hypothetical protein